MKIKMIKTLCSVMTAGTIMLTGISASAEDNIMTPITDQPDNICGKISVYTTTERDTYVSIYKRTPEFPTDGYLVYDTVIRAEEVHVDYPFIFNLEYNNFNYEAMQYEGDYVIKIGIPTYAGSDTPTYYTETFIIEDSDYTDYDTEYTYKITVTEDELDEPLCEVTEEDVHTKTVELTFSAIEYQPGDANCDRKLTAADAAMIAKYLAEQRGDELPSHADYNKDGNITALDAALIAKYLAEQSINS